MENIKSLTNLTPVKSYTPPKLPTFKNTRNNPALLKKLPFRWQNNKKIITCIGIMGVGVITLPGCTERAHNGGGPYAPIYVTAPTEQEARYTYVVEEELKLVTHNGGSLEPPIYVVHLTEQEAYGIIRMQLEAAGLNFGAAPPQYYVDSVFQWSDIVLDLFDADKNVAVTNISWEDRNREFMRGGRDLTEAVTEEFAKQSDSLSVGVFYNPGETLRLPSQDTVDWPPQPSDEEIAEAKVEARPILEAQLTAQIQEFVDFLRSEGILE